MRSRRQFLKKMGMAALGMVTTAPLTFATTFRQYYDTNWVYNTGTGYYYTYYYYRPVVNAQTYSYHYCIYYPARPRYIYYYNPVNQVYWGRFEVGAKGDNQYSLLDNKDRKKDLDSIPESAFPKPAGMPFIPGSEDKVAMTAPPDTNLPGEKPKAN